MTAALRRTAIALAAIGVVLVPTPVVLADSVRYTTVCTFADERIDEASGLVDLGKLLVTANDSGDVARVFAVDPSTGETVGTTYFHADVSDVESLAPVDAGHVWVGDTGGNIGSRTSVEVYKVRVGRGTVSEPEPEHYTLRYPAGSHDTESLFTDRRGRLYLVTKAVTGGIVLRAPRKLHPGSNPLDPVARVPLFATDAALLSDGRHVVIRSYRMAAVYRLRDFLPIGSFRLPEQKQGEGISVGPGDRIRLSSEGMHAPVLEMRLPAEVVRKMRNPDRSATPSPRATVQELREEQQHPDRTWLAWLVGAAVVAGAIAVGLALRRSR